MLRKSVLAVLVVVAMPSALVFAAAAARADTDLEPDPRLDVKVTVAAKDQPIGDFLVDLSDQVDVPLSAHLSIANECVTVLVRDKPVRLLMDELKLLLDGTWVSEEVDHTIGYYLNRTYNWRALRDQRRASAEQALRRAIERMIAADGLAPADLRTLLNTDPDTAIQMAWMPDSCRKYGLKVLAQLPATQLDYILSRRFTQLKHNEMPPLAQAWVEEIIPTLEAEAENLTTLGEPLGEPPPRREDIILTFYVARQADGSAQMQFGLQSWGGGAVFHVYSHPTPSELADWDSLGDAAKALGLAPPELLDHLNRTEAGRQIVSRMEQQDKRFERVGMTALQGGKVLTIRLVRGQERSFSDVVAAMHEQCDMDIIADAYLGKPGRLPLPEDVRNGPPDMEPVRFPKISVEIPADPDRMLDFVSNAFGREWVRDRGIVRLRSRFWYEDLLADPPQWAVTYLRERLDQNDRLDLSDLVWVACKLDNSQLGRLGNVSELRSQAEKGTLDALINHPTLETLRFYGGLNEGQRSALFNRGLPAHFLTAEQLALLQSCVQQAVDRQQSWFSLPESGRPIAIQDLMDTVVSARSVLNEEPPEELVTFSFVLGPGADFQVSFRFPPPKAEQQ